MVLNSTRKLMRVGIGSRPACSHALRNAAFRSTRSATDNGVGCHTAANHWRLTPHRRVAKAANPNRRVRLLHRLRADMHIGEREELAGERDLARRPARLPEAQILVGPGTAFVERHAERGEFGLVPACPDADRQPPARHPVERRQALGGGDRIAIRHDQHRHAYSDAVGVRGDERHRHQRVVNIGPRRRPGRAVDDDVVVDKDGVEAQRLGLRRGQDDRVRRRFETEIIGVRTAGRELYGHGASRCVCSPERNNLAAGRRCPHKLCRAGRDNRFAPAWT